MVLREVPRISPLTPNCSKMLEFFIIFFLFLCLTLSCVMPLHCFFLSLFLSPSLCLFVFLLLYASLHCWVNGVNLVVVVLRGKANLSAFEVGDVDEDGGTRGGAGGLEHGSGQGSAVGDLVELFGAKVVEEDMEGDDVFDEYVLGGSEFVLRGS